MAQYTINYTCGHSEVKQMFGPEKERASKRAWLEKGVCLDCQRAKEAQVALQEAQTLHIVELTGSEKQIAWALRLRSEFIASFEKDLEGAQQKTDKGVQEPNGYTVADGRAAFYRVINRYTTAKWWIENRDGYRRALNDEYTKEFAHA